MLSYDEIINSRKSVRKYTQEVPDQSFIDKMLEAAQHAPSPSNSQPVRYVLIDSPEARRHLKSSMEQGYNYLVEKAAAITANHAKIMHRIDYYWKYSCFIFDAPLLFAAGVASVNESFNQKLQKENIALTILNDNTPLDISLGLSMSAFIHKAVDIGIGTCILTAPLSFITDTKTIPGLSEMRLAAFITAGFPDESPEKTNRVDLNAIFKKI